MYEVELKVRADHARVRERLAELDAVERAAIVQRDTYYDAPHRDFAETDEALRMRSIRPVEDDGTDPDEERTVVTYKGPLVETESKTREEFETTVGDDAAMWSILDNIGFTPAATVEKTRERYDLDGYTVTLDDVTDLGQFVEVETETDEAGVDTAREGARELLERLGLDPDDQIRVSYLGLLLADGK